MEPEATDMPVESVQLSEPSEAIAALNVPHLAEYFGIWCMHEQTFRAAVDHVLTIDIGLHVQQQKHQAASEARAASGGRDYPVMTGGVAVIELRGPLMKFVSSLSGGTSTVRARQAIRAAANDPDVSTILLRIDSPGGTVSGTLDLGEDVARAAKQKNVVAFIEDMGASAAYWIASQARKVYTNATAIIGSIGTYGVLYDQSVRAAQMGITVHIVKAGDHKGDGVPGTKITDAQLNEVQQIVDKLNAFFVRGVSKGRSIPMESARALATGQVWVGAEAQEHGLTDGVKSIDDVLRTVRNESKQGAARQAAELETPTMAENDPTNSPKTDAGQQAAAPQSSASLEELKAAMPNASAEFLLSCLEKKLNVQGAALAWSQHLEQALAEKSAESDANAAKAAAKHPLLADGGTTNTDGNGKGDATAFQAAVDANIEKGMGRKAAVLKAAEADPDGHRAFVRSANAEHRRPTALFDNKHGEQ